MKYYAPMVHGWFDDLSDEINIHIDNIIIKIIHTKNVPVEIMSMINRHNLFLCTPTWVEYDFGEKRQLLERVFDFHQYFINFFMLYSPQYIITSPMLFGLNGECMSNPINKSFKMEGFNLMKSEENDLVKFIKNCFKHNPLEEKSLILHLYKTSFFHPYPINRMMNYYICLDGLLSDYSERNLSISRQLKIYGSLFHSQFLGQFNEKEFEYTYSFLDIICENYRNTYLHGDNSNNELIVHRFESDYDLKEKDIIQKEDHLRLLTQELIKYCINNDMLYNNNKRKIFFKNLLNQHLYNCVCNPEKRNKNKIRKICCKCSGKGFLIKENSTNP